MIREIRFPSKFYEELQRHLFREDGREGVAYVFAGPNAGPERVTLLVREVRSVPSGMLLEQSQTRLEVKSAFVRSLLVHADETGMSLIECHSHPGSVADVTFSSVDLRDERTKFPYVAAHLPQIHHGTLVFGRESVDAHLYDALSRQVVPVDRITILASPLCHIIPTSTRRMARGRGGESVVPAREAERYARQVQAFGPASQARLRGLLVGIVGVGSVGTLLAQELALLGICHFVVVDPDRVEPSNLNRLVGAGPVDADQRTAKVDVAARLLHSIAPDAQIHIFPTSVTDPGAHTALKSVDVLFGATDNRGARLVMNDRLHSQYLIPYIDLGTGLEADTDGHLTVGGAWVRVSLPGDRCLHCIDAVNREEAARDLLPASERDRLRRAGYGTDVPAPSVIFLNGVAASLAVGEFMNLVTGFKPSHSLLYYNLLTQRVTPVQASGRDDCPSCSPAGLLGLGDLEPFPNYAGATSNLPVDLGGLPLVAPPSGVTAPEIGNRAEEPHSPPMLPSPRPAMPFPRAAPKLRSRRASGRTLFIAALLTLALSAWLMRHPHNGMPDADL